MNPPVEPQTSETLAHAVESLRRSDVPLTGRQILSAIPPPSRVDAGTLDRLLTEDFRVILWPPRTRSAQARYWTQRPEDVVDSLLPETLADAALTISELQRKVGNRLAGFAPAQRRALIESRVNGLAAAGKLYVHPPPKGTQPKYSAKPATADVYLARLRKELDALAAKLAPAGITREQILDALRAERPADDLAQRIVEFLKTKPGGIGLGQLREELGFAKIAFDAAVISLYRQRRVYLDQHDYPLGLNEAAKNELVSDGDGNYFVVIGLRDSDDESVL
ncbi:hypothetical protein SBA3_530016 [Candidatus Sulfopaludibacter sp. SbA3]|nr:hypothetical protein SBA3_530016 [Candidatus Sulfopaludibacter sp. SbA3]